MQTSTLIIGSETEYAHLVTHEHVTKAESYYENELTWIALGALMDALPTVCPSAVETQRRGIETFEEHRRVEEALAAQLEITKHDSATQQRRGETGWYLANGARYYPDMLHPEYSCPEACGPFSAALAQLAGDRIIERCRVAAEDGLRRELVDPSLSLYVYKNNCNRARESWGGHENYLLSAKRYDELLPKVLRERAQYAWRWTSDVEHLCTATTHALLLFMIVRQILIGEGKIGSWRYSGVKYQLSERAEYFTQIASLDTTHKRGILNTRNISYTGPDAGLRRLHVICGDSNVSQLSLVLKFASAGLLLRMIEDGYLERVESYVTTPLVSPVREMHAVSHDMTLTHALDFQDGTKHSALECMEEFLRLAEGYLASVCEPQASEWSRGCALWRQAHTGLASEHPERTIARSLGWVLKRTLLDTLCKQGKLSSYSDARAVHAALQYHTTNRAVSLYERMVRAGKAHTIFSEEEIEAWIHAGPQDTRAYLRSEIIRRYSSDIRRVSWFEVSLAGHLLELGDPRKGGKEQCKRLLDGSPTSVEFAARVASGEYDAARVCYAMNTNPFSGGRK